MRDPAVLDGATLGAEQLSSVGALVEANRFPEALDAANAIAALGTWRGPEARVLAGRLAAHLGDHRLATACFRCGHREHPYRSDTLVAYGRILSVRRGPWWTLGWLDQRMGKVHDDRRERAHLRALQATCHAELRDFRRAHRRIEEALELGGEDDPWIHVERAYVLRREDRQAEAIESAKRALMLEPSYRPAIHQHAALLAEDRELGAAIAVLEPFQKRCSSYAIDWHLAQLLEQAKRYAEALASARRAQKNARLADRETRPMLWAAIARCAYRLGDRNAALEAARAIESRWGDATADRIAEAESIPRVVELPVEHIRQHHATCAPATLTAIARYFERDVDHLEVAEQICYGGTPAHRERRWALTQGFVVRELDVDWESSTALIDAGIPFTLVTRAASSGHLQAVVGYDAVRRLLLIRDPSTPVLLEYDVDRLLEHEEHHGPRGMVLVPPSHESKLPAELPAGREHDRIFALHEALDRHDRDQALLELAAMRAEHSASKHLAWAEFAWASYEGDGRGERKAAETLIELFPKIDSLALLRARAIAASAPYAERMEELGKYRWGNTPGLLRAYAYEVMQTVRGLPEAGRALRQAIRLQPADPESYYALGAVERERGAIEASFEATRAAALLDDTNDLYARALFAMAGRANRLKEALSLLQWRVDRARGRAGGPARLLFESFASLGRPAEGWNALEACAEVRPDDGEVALVCAEARIGFGDSEGARAWLERAHNAPEEWRLVVEARIAQARGEAQQARRLLRQAAERFPRNLDVQREWVAAAIDEEGLAPIAERLRQLVQTYPENIGLKELLFEVLRSVPEEAEARLAAHLEEHPDHRFAWIELVYARLALAKHDAAEQTVVEAQRYVGEEPISLTALAEVALARGDFESARELVLRALSLDPDHLPALRVLPETGGRTELARAAAQVHALLLERGSRGRSIDGLFALYRHLDAERMERMAREIFDAFQDFPSAWTFAIRILIEREELDEAHGLAAEGCARFESSIEMHGIRAFVEQLRGDFDSEIAARRDRLRLAPLEERFVADLAGALRAADRQDEARVLLEDYVARLPRAGLLHAELGDLELAEDRQQAAFERYLLALPTLAPRSAAWTQARVLAEDLDRNAELVEAIEALVEESPHRGDVRVALAECLVGAARREALEEALRLDPTLVDARDLLAVDLAESGRLDEAREVCFWPSEEAPALTLRGRLAWLLAEDGQRREACQTMEALIAEHPAYGWGIERLLQWYEAAGRPDDHIRVSRLRLEAQPHSAQQCVRHAEVLVEEERPYEAIPFLERALRLEPKFEGAAVLWLEILLNGGRHDDAADLLERLASQLRAETVQILRARGLLRSAKGRLEEVWTALEPVLLGELPRPEASVLGDEVLFAELDEFVLLRTTKLLTSDAKPASPQALADFWVHLARARARGGIELLLDDIATLNEAGWTTLASAIEDASHGSRLSRLWLRASIVRHRQRLRTRAITWGAVGYFYVVSGLHRAACTWLTSREAKDDVEPWMLANLIEAAWSLRRLPLAHETVETALALPADHTLGRLRAWGAFSRALNDDPSARELLDRREPEELRPIWQMAKVLIEARENDAAGRDVSAAIADDLERLMPSRGKAGDVAYDAFRRALRPWRALAKRKRSRGSGDVLLWIAIAAALIGALTALVEGH